MSHHTIQWQGRQLGLHRPRICPHCHIANFPSYLFHQESTTIEGHYSIVALWRCTNSECKRIIATENKPDSNTIPISSILNGLPKGPDWPKPIAELSIPSEEGEQTTKSKFIKTYLQSLQAEKAGLDEIAGMGYRKAIEYLVKDWAIQSNPDKKEEVKSKWLTAVIKDFYEGDLKDILERATWIGNDQTHYNKLFEEFDVNDLKDLIDLIMVELDREFKKRHYIETIEKRK